MAQLAIDLTGSGGLTKRYFGDFNRSSTEPNLIYTAEESQMADGIYNAFSRNGYLSPANGSYNKVTVSGAVSSFVTASSTPYSNFLDLRNNYLWISSKNVLGRITPGDTDMFTFSSGAASNFVDIISYTVNNSQRLFVASDQGSTVVLMTYIINSNTWDTNWSGSTAQGASSISVEDTPSNNQRLIVADNGFMYWITEKSVHKIDGTATGGTNGTLYPNVLIFPDFKRIYDVVDYKGLMYMAVNTSANNNNDYNQFDGNLTASECGVYIWDRLTTIVKMRDYITIPGIRAIKKIYVSHDGDIRVIGVTNMGTGIIYQYTGSIFKKLYEIGIRAFPMIPSSLDVTDSATYWLGLDGNVYMNGKLNIDNKEGIFKIASLADILPSQYTNLNPQSFTLESFRGRMLKVCESIETVTTGNDKRQISIYIGFTYTDTVTGTQDGMIQIRPYTRDIIDSVTPKAQVGNVYLPIKYLPNLSTLSHATIYCIPSASTGTETVVTLKFYANQSTTAFKTLTLTRSMINKGYVSIELNKPYCNAFQMEIEWDTTQTLGSNDFCPSLMILNYEPTAKIPR